MKFRPLLLTLFLGLLLLPSAARGQSQNCSAITFQLTTSSTTTHDCSTPALSPSGNAYTTTWTFHVTCNNTQTGSIYQQNDISLSDNGHCGPLVSGQILDCPPSYTWSKTVPSTSSSTTYNQLNFQGIDNVMTGGGSPCVPRNGATAFVQCLTQACVSSGFCGPSGCGCFWPCTTPIILDITGKGYSLTDVKDGVLFDFAGDGNPVKMAWTAPGADNAFLVLPGPDGLVHNGMQLFGNLTAQPASNNPNGFAALAVYDDPKNGGNGDGIIDSRDAVFASLRLWIDANHDGVSQPEELFTLPSLDVNSISLTYKLSERTDQYGNVFRYRGQVNPGDAANTSRMAYDVVFVKPSPSASKPACVVPVPTKGGLLSTSGR